MSEDASYEIQKAIVNLLKNNAAVMSIVDDRVFDRVQKPVNGKAVVQFPYISLGPDQEIPRNADCIRASEFVLQIDAWSRAVGYAEVKRIARAIEDALDEVELPLVDNAQVYLEYDGRRIFRDPDGLTSQAALMFRAGVEKF